MVTSGLDQHSTRRMQGMRQVRLRPASAHLYPGLTAGEWLPAARVAAQLLGEAVQRGARAVRDRILPAEHFEFQGGHREVMLRYRARTRWTDYPSTRMS